MRTMLTLAALLASALTNSGLASAGEGCSRAVPAGCHQGREACHGGCRGDGCRLLRRHRCRGADIDGLDRHFNCGCTGSYNYPVPPQYTYHWPGMYKQNLMTDYISPWRFPPLKPYVDEAPAQAAAEVLPALRPISATGEIGGSQSAGEIESISSRLARMAR